MKIDHKPLDKVIKAWSISNKLENPVRIYNTDELFEEIDGNPEDILFKIPDDILSELGWGEGDEINFTQEGKTIVLTRTNVAGTPHTT